MFSSLAIVTRPRKTTKKTEGNMDFNHTYADYIDEEGIAAIKELEDKTGKCLLAFYSPPGPANLNSEELQKIKELESKLCVRLVAYEKQ